MCANLRWLVIYESMFQNSCSLVIVKFWVQIFSSLLPQWVECEGNYTRKKTINLERVPKKSDA